MSQQAEPSIVEGELMSEPHVAGRRVSVLSIHDRVEKRGVDPKSVAGRLDLDLADVYRALAYYHDNPEKMQDLETLREQVVDATDERDNDAVDPDSLGRE